MRTFIDLQALVTFDVDQVQEAFKQRLTFDDTDAATASVVQSGLVQLAALASATPFNFGSVTSASLLIVVAYEEIQLQLNSNTAPLVPVRPIPAAPAGSLFSRFQRDDQPGLVVWRGKVGSLYLTNPSAVAAASAFVAVVGNAT